MNNRSILTGLFLEEKWCLGNACRGLTLPEEVKKIAADAILAYRAAVRADLGLAGAVGRAVAVALRENTDKSEEDRVEAVQKAVDCLLRDRIVM